MSSFNWPPTGGGNQIVEYASFAAFPTAAVAGNGAFAFALDTQTLYESNGVTWTVIAGPGVALSIGTYDSGVASANGQHIDTNALIAQSATATVPGMVNISTQTFAGNKTFTGAISASNLSGTNTGNVTIGTANGLSIAGQVISLGLSSTSTNGALSSTDWNTFNNKQAALTFGNFTDAGTDGIVVTGGTGAVIGTGTSIAQHVADATHNGYLSSTDWNTFNGKQSTVLTSAHIFVGNVSNVATDVAVSGDLTAVNTGAFTVAKIQGTVVSGTTGTTNVAFSASPTFTGAVSAPVGSVTTPGLNFSDTGTGFYRPSADNLSVAAAGVQRLQVTTVGITVTGTSSLSGTVTGGTFISSSAGSAATPAYRFAGGGTWGIYSVTTNVLGFSTSSTERFRIDTAGNMLIGTTTTGTGLVQIAGSLSYNGSTSGQITFVAPAIAGTQSYTLPAAVPVADGQFLTSTIAGVQSWSSTLPAGATGPFVLKAGDTMTGVLQLTNGSAGTPAVNFGDVNSGVYRSALNEVAISSNSTQVVKFAGGGATFNTALFATGQYKGNTGGSASSPTFAPHNSATNTGFYAPSSGTAGITTAGVERMRVTNGGNMLIGTSTDATGILQVNGTLSLNGATSGQVSFTSPTVAGTQGYTLPTALPSASGQALVATTGGVMSWSTVTALKAPTVQTFASGSGTYTTPTSPAPLYIEIMAVGGGGGGSGSGTSGAGNGGAGGNTTFGTTLIAANGGAGGVYLAGGGPTGGTASLGSGPLGFAVTGGNGSAGVSGIALGSGGLGGSSFMGGGGSGGANGFSGAAGGAYGSGGGGAGGGTGIGGQAGGAAGGTVKGMITSPSATYAYAVGAAGTVGTAGTAGTAGGTGIIGFLQITEFYQ